MNADKVKQEPDGLTKTKLRDSRLTVMEDIKPVTKPNQRNTKYAQKFTEEAAKPESKAKISKLQHEALTVSEKLEKARNKASTKAKSITKADTSKLSDKNGGESKTAATISINRISQIGAVAFHNQMSKAEDDNIGTESAHKIEYTVECAYGTGKNAVQSAIHHSRDKPIRQFAKLKSRSARFNANQNEKHNTSYEKGIKADSNPRSSALSRYMQKRRIKKQYAKTAREVKSNYQRVKQAGTTISSVNKGIQRIAAAVAKDPKVWGVIAVIVLIFFVLSAFMTTLSFMLGGVSEATSGMYLADENEITAAELMYTEWETELKIRIENIPSEHPGYDEYLYNIGDIYYTIRHEPFVLMSYLTAVYGDFNADDIKPNLQNLFNTQHVISFSENVIDGRRILTATLTSQPLTSVITTLMSHEQSLVYQSCMETKGNRQFVGSPTDYDWLPYVTDYFGYRIHPIRGGKNYHTGIDIAMPTGTDLLVMHDGVVTTRYDESGYGKYIIIESSDGLRSLYAHCDELLFSNGQVVSQGDVIAKSGNSGGSTGPHLHLELRKNGILLNPIFFINGG